MAIKENIKSGVNFAVDTVSDIAAAIAEKNRLRAQLNHIKQLIKTDSATRDQAYIELGRFFYENMREGAAAENEAICAVIDAASDRISKASLKYMELLNLQNETKIRSENTDKIRRIVSEKASASAKAAKEKSAELAAKAKTFAADTAEKAKAAAVQGAQKAKTVAAAIKDKASDTVEDMRDRFDPERSAELEQLIAEEQAKLQEAEVSAVSEPAAEPATEIVEPAEESPDSFDF